MSVTSADFGNKAHLFRLAAHGVMAEVTDFGAGLVSLRHPDGANVVLGFDSAESYQADSQSMGVIVGRYANRISRGLFDLDGTKWRLPCNNGPNHLHGGPDGFGRRLWQASIDDEQTSISFTLHSPHLDQGYPGSVIASATYQITAEGRLRLTLEASSDRPTVVNLAPHAYFDLAGEGKVNRHVLKLYAGSYTPVDEELIPLGITAPVDGTSFDYRQPRRFNDALDMNMVVDGPAGILRPVADVWDPVSKRMLSVRATAPGVQVYGGGGLGAGGLFTAHAGFCLEPQYFPDSPNQPGFTAPIVAPDSPYRECIEYSLGLID